MGDLSLVNTVVDWQFRTAKGKLTTSSAEYDLNNVETGSTYRIPIFYTPAPKQNGGVMHGPSGHTTHFATEIVKAIQEKRSHCR